MNIIAVDDEQFALELCEATIRDVLPECSLSAFVTPSKALSYAENNQVDVAFLDIEMGSMSGIELARRLQAIYGRTNIVFVTGYSEYALDSYAIGVADYLLKPLSRKLVARALEQLRFPVGARPDTRARVYTFGNFEIFANGRPLLFTYAKTKELLAYLVHREGAMCDNNEILAVLWEEKTDTPSLKSQFRNVVSDLMRRLKSEGLEDIVLKKHGQMAVIPDKFLCDYYDFLKGVPYAVQRYAGEYMAQYSWAEAANSWLMRRERTP